MERVARIELASSAWKAEVLPLNYTRNLYLYPQPIPNTRNRCCLIKPCQLPALFLALSPAPCRPGGGGWIRTTEAYASDLQSDPFGHSGTPPKKGARFCLYARCLSNYISPPATIFTSITGFRPTADSRVHGLQSPGGSACRQPQKMSGAATKSRTRDLLITNQLLYQLSYSGTLTLMAVMALMALITLMALSGCRQKGFSQNHRLKDKTVINHLLSKRMNRADASLPPGKGRIVRHYVVTRN